MVNDIPKMAEIEDFEKWLHGLTLLIAQMEQEIEYNVATDSRGDYTLDFEYLDKLIVAKKAIAAIVIPGEPF